MRLRELLLTSGQSPEYPDRDADHHAHEDDLGDQEEEACRDTNEREEENQQDLPQQDSDHTRGGDAENGLQDGQAPLEEATLRQFTVKGVKQGDEARLTWTSPALRIATLRICHRSGYQLLQDLQIDVGQAPDVDTYLPNLVLSQLG